MNFKGDKRQVAKLATRITCPHIKMVIAFLSNNTKLLFKGQVFSLFTPKSNMMDRSIRRRILY